MKRKVLMATMGLDIGGAETHIVELSKELQRRGCQVMVASNGGVYVPELEQCGIRHFSVPMHRRSLIPMLKSYVRLGRIIRQENPDIVHAHARIPGFICHLLQKRLHFPFVATAHWVFKASGLQGMLTRWGQKTIAVSEDIKAYLKENYGLRDENIFVTINGIATDKFSKEISGARIIEEFHIDSSLPVICHVSRLDLDRALAAERLIESCEGIRQAIGDFTLLIVGGGTEFDRLLKLAAEKSAGKSRIILTGARTDINELIAVGDVFVGVSRAALEAMACEKPVILAGNEGFDGVFTPEKLERAKLSNFCCRGSEEVTAENLTEAVKALFSKTSEERAALGAACRQIILDHYSVGRMAEDSLRAYEAALEGRLKVVMSGYYGFDNAGDESILQTVYSGISRMPQVGDITVLSRRPGETRSRYGYKACHRMNILSVRRAIKNCDILISGGGSLLQDKTSTRSLLYYLHIIRMAQRMGKKVMIYANGIGPVDREANRRRVRDVLEKVDLITLREAVSAKELASMGIPEEKIHVTTDPVFLMEPAAQDVGEKLLKECGLSPEQPFVAVCVRRWTGDYQTALARTLDQLYDRYGYMSVFIALQHPGDLEVSRRIAQQMTRPCVVAERAFKGSEMMALFSRAQFVLAMRLHALIFASTVCVPSVGFVYDPKLQNYLDLLEMPSAGSVEALSEEQAWQAVEWTVQNRDQLVRTLTEKLPELKALAMENETYLKKLIDKET